MVKGVRAIIFVMLMLAAPIGIVFIGADLPEQESQPGLSDFPTSGEPLENIGPSFDAGLFEPFFTENRGQFGQWPARYYAQGRPFSVAFGDGWIVYYLQGGDGPEDSSAAVVRVTFVGANAVPPNGREVVGQKSHYLRGSDPSGWVTQVSNYRTVVYQELWEGIDLAFHFADGQLKYEFTVSPGAEPSAIMMAYEGIDLLQVCGTTGDLIVRAGGLILRDRAPISYQDVDGVLEEVPTVFLLQGGGRVAFDISDHEPDLALTIDPGMLFSTFLGESGDDVGYDVTVDGDGYVYVAGRTSSSDFPLTTGAYDTRFMTSEAFVSKFSPDGASLVYSTFIGGDQDEEATGVVVDENGLVCLTGTTYSSDFPTTSGAFCETRSGERDAFALKLNVTGSSLEYSTYLGGRRDEEAKALDLDSNGSVYVTGWTNSSDFPTVEGSFMRAGEGLDVFVVKLNEDGSELEYSSVIGGNGDDYSNDLAIDNSGCAYFTGWTASKFYPITEVDTDWLRLNRGSENPDVFVTKLNATGEAMVYSTFIGEVYGEWGTGIDVDREGCAYVVGATLSSLFPQLPSIYPAPTAGKRPSPDSFILKLAPSGDHLEYSKVLNVSYTDEARAVSVDGEGCAFVSGYVDGWGNFHTTPDAFQPSSSSGEREAYVLRLDDQGDQVLYASYLGGNNNDHANALALDRNDLVYVTGITYSTQGFPTTPGVYDNTSEASTTGLPVGDAFLCKLDISHPYLVNDTSDLYATTGDTYTFNLTIADNVGVAEVGLEYWFAGSNVSNITNITLDLLWGNDRNGSWIATIEISSSDLVPFYYRVWAKDANGLNVTIRDHKINVLDNDLPFFENLSPASGGTGNEINLSVRVGDNICVSEVAAIYSQGGLINLASGNWMTPSSTSNGSNGIYNFTIVLPWYSTDPFQYQFWANDTSRNWNKTEMFEVEVVDDDRGEITVQPLPDEVTTGQELTHGVFARDNIGVASVTFTWWFDVPDSEEPITWPMDARSVDAVGIGNYTTTFRVPFDIIYPYVPRIKVIFNATDLAGNIATSGIIVIDVRDDDRPWFLEDIGPRTATTGDPFNITVDVWDNIALANVWVQYWYGTGGTFNLSLAHAEGNAWNTTITIPTTARVLHYYFDAIDTSGNGNWSAQIDLLVLDNDAPVVAYDSSDEVTTTGDRVTFKVRVEDNLFVKGVRVVYWMGDGEQVELELVGQDLNMYNNGTYRAITDAPSNASGALTYIIETFDDAGNLGTTEERHIEVRDNEIPWFGDDLSDMEAWRGEMFHFDIVVGDNVGVDELWCEWWFGESGHLNESMPLGTRIAIDVPLDPEGPLRYLFAIRDAAGNWNSTDVFVREVLNRPPVITGLDVWNVTEEEDEELFLLEFIDDRDDSTWVLTLESPDPSVILDVYTLRVRHDVWVEDYVIELSVSDGRNTTWQNVTLHVLAVNDPPRIDNVMFNGTPFDNTMDIAEFKEGRQDVLAVQAFDEEGDRLNYSWLRNGVEVASGQEVMYRDLPLGIYVLTLNVDDGTDTTSLQISVIVTEEVETSTTWQWAVVLLVVVIIVLAVLTVMVFGRRDE